MNLTATRPATKIPAGKAPVAIIGGGLAGLAAADRLEQAGVPFIVFEAGSQIAGLARSFTDEEGFSHDFGAHFLTNRLADAVGIGDDCITVKHYGETVFLGGRSYPYPFGLACIPRMGLSWLKGKLSPSREATPPASAADWFRSSYGHALANEIALPLLEAWSGASAEKLSPEVGESLPGGIGKTLYLKIAAKLTRRAVACGYNREKPERASVYHVYPKNGVATLCEKLAEGMEDRIMLDSPVESITVENESVTSVRANEVTYKVSAVVSTAPAPVLPKLVRGTSRLQKFANFRYRPMTFVNLRFKGRNLLPDTVIWFPEKQFPFFRLTEAPISMPWLAPEGKTIITADFGCERGDEIWSMSEEALGDLCLEHLEKLLPEAKGRYLGCSVLRTPVAYPMFLNQYEKERQQFEISTGIDNLISVGRNGEFAHIFMEDVYWRTRKKIDALVERLGLQTPT